MAYLEYQPHSSLFHFTSRAGFEGIISSKSMWLSSLEFTNDPRELRFGYDNIVRAFELASQRANDGRARYMAELLKSKVSKYLRSAGIYCCCFTYDGDNLPMWSSYGENYKGVSIGFRPSFMADSSVRIQKVRYLGDDAENTLVEEATIISRIFPIEAPELEQAIQLSNTISSIVAIKHSAWSYEREIRITHARGHNDPAPWDHPMTRISGVDRRDRLVPRAKLHYRTADNQQIPYLVFPFGRDRRGVFDHSGAIERIVIGPKSDLTVDGVASLMSENGFRNFTVHKSSCLMR